MGCRGGNDGSSGGIHPAPFKFRCNAASEFSWVTLQYSSLPRVNRDSLSYRVTVNGQRQDERVTTQPACLRAAQPEEVSCKTKRRDSALGVRPVDPSWSNRPCHRQA